jgi:hypothetical protein
MQTVATPAVAPNGQLTAISCPSATPCISVGVSQDGSGRDTALAEMWNGTRWYNPEAAPGRASQPELHLEYLEGGRPPDSPLLAASPQPISTGSLTGDGTHRSRSAYDE